MGMLDKWIRKTKAFDTVVKEYSRITERNFEIIKSLDEANDFARMKIADLQKEAETKNFMIDALRRQHANVPDATKHMEVVSECERLKFVNLELEDVARTLHQKIWDLEQQVKDLLFLAPVPRVNHVGARVDARPPHPLSSWAASLSKPKKARKKTTTSPKAKKSPKLARGTPRRKRSR